MEDVQLKRGPGRPPKTAVQQAALLQQMESPGPREDDSTQARIRSLELQLRALSGRRESREEVADKARQIVDRMFTARVEGGANQWRVHNSRYKDAHGDPVTHDFWSDAKDPESARADYNRRNGRYWSPDEGDDPLKFELITEQ
jgi:hypothetical protein